MPRGMICTISKNHFDPERVFFFFKERTERVARGYFHERVGETPVHWLPPGVGPTQKPFSVSENRPLENFLGPTQFLYSRLNGLLKLIFHTNQYNGA